MLAAADYDRFKAWLSLMFEHPELGLPPVSMDAHPVAVLGRMEEAAPSKARQGLRMAIGDILEMTADLSPADVDIIDERCRMRGLPTLSEMRARFSRALKAIVRRGRIRSETEYYLVRGALEFASSETERTVLQDLLSQFEGRRD